MFAEAQKWLWGPAQSLMKLLNIMALLSIKPRGFEQDKVEMLNFVCYKPDTCKYNL